MIENEKSWIVDSYRNIYKSILENLEMNLEKSKTRKVDSYNIYKILSRIWNE